MYKVTDLAEDTITALGYQVTVKSITHLIQHGWLVDNCGVIEVAD